MSNLLPYSVSAMSDSGPIMTGITAGSSTGGLPSFAQVITQDFSNGGALTSESLAFNSSVRAGSLLVLMTFWAGSVTGSVTDNQGNSWNSLPIMNPGVTDFGQLFYAFSAKSGPTTITLHLSGAGGTFIEMTIAEYAGSITTLDASNTLATGTGTTFTSNSITTTKPGELILGFFVTQGRSGPYTVASPFTLRGPGTFIAMNLADQISASGGPFSVSFTDNASVAWQAGIAAFF